MDTRVNQVDPNVGGVTGNKSLAAGVRKPPFPPDALLKQGFDNPYNAVDNVIDNLLVGPPPPTPIPPSGTVYYSSYQSDGVTPSGNGQPAFSFCITGYGNKGPISLVLPW